MLEMPESEYRQLNAGSPGLKLHKSLMLLKLRLTGGKAVVRIPLRNGSMFHIFHNRLMLIHKIMEDISSHYFQIFTETRNNLSGIFELGEKSRTSGHSREKMHEIIRMEKNRLHTFFTLQKERTRNFYYGVGNLLAQEQLKDLQKLNDNLGANEIHHTAFRNGRLQKQNDLLLREIRLFPGNWFRNSSLFLNKVYLDLYMQAMKNRMESKIEKYLSDYRLTFSKSVLNPLKALQKELSGDEAKNTTDHLINSNGFSLPMPETHFRFLFDEINALFHDLPANTTLPDDTISKVVEEKKMLEVQAIKVDVREKSKLAVSDGLIDYVRRQSAETSLSLARSLSTIRDHIKLINFNLYEVPEDEKPTQDERAKLAGDLIEKLRIEEKQILDILRNLETAFSSGLKNTFIPLSTSQIVKSQALQTVRENTITTNVAYKIMKWNNLQVQKIQDQIVRLIYSKNEEIFLPDKTATQEAFTEDEAFSWIESYTPRPAIVENLPYYYQKLFSEETGTGDEFRVGMYEETEAASTAIARFKEGKPGFLIITGERNSGKTSLSKFVARKHFALSEIYVIEAPRESTSDTKALPNSLLLAMGNQNKDIHQAFSELSKPVTIIINDLELWWQRKENGEKTIQKLIELAKKHHQKVLFILNINHAALNLIHKLTGIRDWSLGVVFCRAFDAQLLRELILTRHHAGGLKFIVDNTPEGNMTSWAFARLFNRFFTLTDGNPGKALTLWTACIKKIQGNTLIMESPQILKPIFFEKLSQDQLLILLQFVYHVRLSISILAEILMEDRDAIEKLVLNLWQKGILVEKFSGIYTINASINPEIIRKFKELKMI
jgi:hypothetical protein